MLIAFFAIIYKPLNLQQPFQEPEVRDSECLVYTASQPFGAGFFVFMGHSRPQNKAFFKDELLFTGAFITIVSFF